MIKSRTILSALQIGGLSLAILWSGCEPQSPPPPPPPQPKPAPAPAPAPAPKPAPPPALTPAPAPAPAPKPAPPPPTPAPKVVAKDLPLPPDVVQFKAEINRASAQLDVVGSRLEAVAGASKDLEKPHEEFNAALMALDTESEGLKKRADDMRERGAAYFETWEKGLAAMSTPEVKAVATKRKAELAGKYTELLTAMQGTRAAYDPLSAGLKEIQTKLDDSLTAETIKALAPDIAKVRAGVKTVKDRIAVVVEKLGAVSSIYSEP